ERGSGHEPNAGVTKSTVSTNGRVLLTKLLIRHRCEERLHRLVQSGGWKVCPYSRGFQHLARVGPFHSNKDANPPTFVVRLLDGLQHPAANERLLRHLLNKVTKCRFVRHLTRCLLLNALERARRFDADANGFSEL